MGALSRIYLYSGESEEGFRVPVDLSHGPGRRARRHSRPGVCIGREGNKKRTQRRRLGCSGEKLLRLASRKIKTHTRTLPPPSGRRARESAGSHTGRSSPPIKMLATGKSFENLSANLEYEYLRATDRSGRPTLLSSLYFKVAYAGPREREKPARPFEGGGRARGFALLTGKLPRNKCCILDLIKVSPRPRSAGFSLHSLDLHGSPRREGERNSGFHPFAS